MLKTIYDLKFVILAFIFTAIVIKVRYELGDPQLIWLVGLFK